MGLLRVLVQFFISLLMLLASTAPMKLVFSHVRLLASSTLMILLFSTPCWASKFNYDIGVGMEYFSGLEEKSLAPGSGTVLRFGAQKGEEIFRYATSFYITSSSGEANFDDSGTTVELTYTLLGGEFNFGFAIYPLGSDSKLELQPYLMATGSTHLASISFDKDAAVSDTFPKSDAAMMFGYALAVGVDYAVAKEWGIKLHVERSAITGALAGSSFSLSGQRVILGLYFH